jgi:hypothetical protein
MEMADTRWSNIINKQGVVKLLKGLGGKDLSNKMSHIGRDDTLVEGRPNFSGYRYSAVGDTERDGIPTESLR